jgi:methylated-DNA-[protein]-cysteine S-methyltransferase
MAQSEVSNKMSFAQKVYELCSKVPKGRITTYKEIGKAIGIGGMVYRAVGVALKHNPCAPIVPCHRVVASDGSIGGFNGQTNGIWIAKKIRLLKEEGVTVKDGRIVDFESKLYTYDA